jgi:hypothetical protein
MAIEHQNISIGEVSAAAAAATAQDTLRDALLGHASGAWTLEEEFDSSGSTVHWVVVKNDHTISGEAVDFWVCIGRVASSGDMGIFVGEDYVAASNILSKFAPRADNPGYILGSNYYSVNGTDIATFTLSTSLPNAAQQPLTNTIPNASTERLFTCVDAEYAVISLNDKAYYVGAITDLIVPQTGLVATPAIGCGELMQGQQGRFFSITQHPVRAADAPFQVSQPHSMLCCFGGAFQDMCMLQDYAMLSGLYGFPDFYQGDRVAASEILAIMATGNEVGYSDPDCRPDKVGALRGKFKGIRMTTGPYAAASYDTIVVDGTKHVVIGVLGSISSGSPYWQPIIPYGGSSAVAKMMMVADTGIAA